MKYYARIGEREWEFSFKRQDGELLATVDDRVYRIDLSTVGDGAAFSLLVDGRSFDVLVDSSGGLAQVQVGGEMVRVQVEDERERTALAVAGARQGGKQNITAVMPGVVMELMIKVGDKVEQGQTLLILEAMKMQNPILAEADGKVTKVHVPQGAAVTNGEMLVELEPLSESE